VGPEKEASVGQDRKDTVGQNNNGTTKDKTEKNCKKDGEGQGWNDRAGQDRKEPVGQYRQGTEEQHGRTKQEGFRGKGMKGTVGKARKDAGSRKARTWQYKTGKAGELLKYRKDMIGRDRKKVKPAMRSCCTYVWL
jgi:hypothetical protein